MLFSRYKGADGFLEKFKTYLDKYVQENFSLKEKPREVAANEIEIPGAGQQLQNDTTMANLRPSSASASVESAPPRQGCDILIDNLFSNLEGAEMALQVVKDNLFKENLFLDLCYVASAFYKGGKHSKALKICEKLFEEKNSQRLIGKSSKLENLNTIVDELKGDKNVDKYEKTVDKITNLLNKSQKQKRASAIMNTFSDFLKKLFQGSHVCGILSTYRVIAQDLINKGKSDIAHRINNELLVIYNQLFTAHKLKEEGKVKSDLKVGYDFFVSTSFLNLNNIESLQQLDYDTLIEGLFPKDLKGWYEKEGLTSLIDGLFLTLDNTAHGLDRECEYDKALLIYKKVREKREKILDPSDKLLLDNFYNIGSVLVNKSKKTGYTDDKDSAIKFCENMLKKGIPVDYRKHFEDLKGEVESSSEDSPSPQRKKEFNANSFSNVIKNTLSLYCSSILSICREVLKYCEKEKLDAAHQPCEQLLELYSHILVTCNKLKTAKEEGRDYPLYSPIVDGFLLTMGDNREFFESSAKESIEKLNVSSLEGLWQEKGKRKHGEPGSSEQKVSKKRKVQEKSSERGEQTTALAGKAEEVNDVKEQQRNLEPKSDLNNTSVQGHFTQDRGLGN